MDTSERVHKYLTDHKVTKLEFVLLTHPHRDHIAGMINILEDENIKIDKIYGNNFDLRYSSSGNQDPDDIEDTEFSSEVYEAVKAAINVRTDKMCIRDSKNTVWRWKGKQVLALP